MEQNIQNIEQAITEFIGQYTNMKIEGITIHCPYWMNKLKNGKVVLRGYASGKGNAKEIREELIRRLKSLPHDLQFKLTAENLRKFAKRERIGIDCSGLVYRVLDELLRLGYGNTGYKNLDEVFSDGITRTNVKKLTSRQYSEEVRNIKDIRLGDMIRLWGGKHAAIIIGNNKKEILYVHSSWLSTKIAGIHISKIRVIDANQSLRDQVWGETTRRGENFGEKYFHPEKGDGVFRLKIFQ